MHIWSTHGVYQQQQLQKKLSADAQCLQIYDQQSRCEARSSALASILSFATAGCLDGHVLVCACLCMLEGDIRLARRVFGMCTIEPMTSRRVFKTPSTGPAMDTETRCPAGLAPQPRPSEGPEEQLPGKSSQKDASQEANRPLREVHRRR